jgi:peptidoglycan hydrolase-like protein with peptidoglycan-binding domain
VKNFQQAHCLEANGDIGKETVQAIDHALAERNSATPASASAIAGLVGNRILRVGDAGPIIQAVQLGLARLGYPLKGSGNYGPATEQAVSRPVMLSRSTTRWDRKSPPQSSVPLARSRAPPSARLGRTLILVPREL